MQTIKNSVSGAEMIMPSTDLGRKLHETLCCVTQITDFENHSDAFGVQQEALELLETKGPEAVLEFASKHAEEIDKFFYLGKAKEVEILIHTPNA